MMLASAVAIAAMTLAAPADESPAPVFASASLRDGSSIKGEYLGGQIAGDTVFMNDLRLDAAIVKSLSFVGTNGESKVSLRNGDVLTMRVTSETFPLKSLLGDLDIPRSSLRSLSLSQRLVAAACCEGLIYCNSFDDDDCLDKPEVGQAAKKYNVQLREGRSGSAIVMPRGSCAFELAFPDGSLKDKGCIEFWAKFLEKKTDFSAGCDPNFFMVYVADGKRLGGFGFAANSGFGASGLVAGFPSGNVASSSGGDMTYSSVFQGEPYTGWHHYAIAWDVDGFTSPQVNDGRRTTTAIFIDGKSVGNVHDPLPARSVEWAKRIFASTMVLGFPMRCDSPATDNRSTYLLDDLKIWNFPKTSFDL